MRLKKQRDGAGAEIRWASKDVRKIQLPPDQYNDISEAVLHGNELRVAVRPSCPAHQTLTASMAKQRRSRVAGIFSLILQILIGVVLALCPPWPPRILKKAVFLAPRRLYNYYLIGGEPGERMVYTKASEALSATNLQLCLPRVLSREVFAVDIFYHLLRTKVRLIPFSATEYLCALEICCEMSVKKLHRRNHERQRSPYLVIFAQPNSSDMGACMIMDPNFADMADFLQCDMLMFDYPGYGASDGTTSESSIHSAIDAIIKYAIETMNYSLKEIILIGFSLGTAASVYAASKYKELGALVLLAPFASASRVVFCQPRRQSSCYLDLFKSYELAASITCPTLVCHGAKDVLVSCKQGQAISEKIPNSQFFLMEKTNHQDIIHERRMWDRTREFLEEKMGIADRWSELTETVATTDTELHK